MSDAAPASPNPQPGPPMISLAAVTWNFALVGRTRMLTEAWLRAKQPTTFVQVPSYRTAVQRLTSVMRPKEDVPVVRPWPAIPARMWTHASENYLRRIVRRRAQHLKRELDKRIDWKDAVGVVISPSWTPWLDELPFGRLVYDCIDDVDVHVPHETLRPLYHKWEDDLVRRVSGAVVTAEPLAEQLRARRPGLSISTIRNGVDVERFQESAEVSPPPRDVPRTDKPIIGFVGALYQWIDWQLIGKVTKALPDYLFVFVGPHDGRGAVDLLASRPNAKFLGRRPYKQVPAYVNSFDVCWVPFDQSEISKAANPVKIYEYLALGKPVVTTPVADTESFGPFVRVGRDADEIVSHLRAAVAEKDQPQPQRVEFATQNSWNVRAREYVDFANTLPISR